MKIPDQQYKLILETLPIVCVDVLIIHEDKCLLLERDNEPAKGQYWFPGGRIYKNELIKDAAVRKAKEETNLDCTFIKIISVEESLFEKKATMLTDLHTVNVCCLMETEKISHLHADHLHKGAKWITKIDPAWHAAVKNPLQLIGFNR